MPKCDPVIVVQAIIVVVLTGDELLKTWIGGKDMRDNGHPDRSNRYSSAAVTHIKYECDSKNLTTTLAR